MKRLAFLPLVALAFVTACADEATQPLEPEVAALASSGGTTVHLTGDVGWTNPQGLEQTAEFSIREHRQHGLRGEAASWREDGVDWYSDEISCFVRDGNSAVFAGPITGGTDEGRYFQIRVTDTGAGGSEDPRDFINVARGDSPFACDTGLLPATSETHTGNLRLHQSW